MAPEFLTSLLDLDEELSQAMWQCSSFAEDGKSEQAFAAVARNFRWPFDFLKRADAWSAGKCTLINALKVAAIPSLKPSEIYAYRHALVNGRLQGPRCFISLLEASILTAMQMTL